MIKICEYIGGSAIYGLKTPDSDKDIRFVFKNAKISQILGLEKHEHQKIETNDTFGFELRFFFNLLRKGNTQALETLFLNENEFILITNEFKNIQTHRYKLIDSEKLFKCLLGYVNGEKKIILGQSTGPLGEKRKEQLKQYGYSYRNCVHALRLLRTGVLFFSGQPYPVNIVKEDKLFGEFILSIKQNPTQYNKDDLIGIE